MTSSSLLRKDPHTFLVVFSTNLSRSTTSVERGYHENALSSVHFSIPSIRTVVVAMSHLMPWVATTLFYDRYIRRTNSPNNSPLHTISCSRPRRVGWCSWSSLGWFDHIMLPSTRTKILVAGKPSWHRISPWVNTMTCAMCATVATYHKFCQVHATRIGSLSSCIDRSIDRYMTPPYDSIDHIMIDIKIDR